jgi:F420-dependent oxidoreductase-like protein
MRIGLMHGDDGTETIDGLIEQVVAEERDGFDTAWFGQVFGTDTLTVLALAGQKTSRMELGTAIVPTYTRHPWAMAQQARTVQAATGSRLTLGIGPSHHIVVENMWGMSYDKPARHVREYLNVLLPLVRGGAVAYNGELYKTNAQLAVKDAKPLPVIISALAPVMLKLAGAVADGTVTWMTGPKTIETHVVPSISSAAKEAGKPAPRVVCGLPVAVCDNPQSAKVAAAGAFAIYGGLPNYRRMLDKEGAAGPADVAIVGDEASVEKQLRAVASAGATDFLAAVFPAEADAGPSMARTRALLKSLVGKV